MQLLLYGKTAEGLSRWPLLIKAQGKTGLHGPQECQATHNAPS
jgi:hypothetical protein